MTKLLIRSCFRLRIIPLILVVTFHLDDYPSKAKVVVSFEKMCTHFLFFLLGNWLLKHHNFFFVSFYSWHQANRTSFDVILLQLLLGKVYRENQLM